MKGTAIAFLPREAPPAVKRAIRAIDEPWADEVRSLAYQAYFRYERRAPVLVEVLSERVSWFDLAEPHRREPEGR